MGRTSKKGRILIVDDEEKICAILGAVLRDAGHEVLTARDGIEAIEKSRDFVPHLMIVDLQMPRMDGIETISRLRDRFPKAVAIILTAHGTIRSAVEAIKQGVYDYLTKPYDNEQMLLIVKRALEVYGLKEEIDQLKNELQKEYGLDRIIGESPVMENIRQQIRQIAETDGTVLIEGESGTGKELVAKAIHFESKRRNDPLVILDCTAIPSHLIESEFFGHEKGAFTDARERRIGKFEQADAGTVFLDEVSELPLDAQSRLLRVLQEKEFARVGSNIPVKVDIRFIAATNKNLEDQMREGKFREDLYYRLNVLKLRIPTLVEHKEDIHLYVKHFLAKHGNAFGKSITGISDQALEALMDRKWKGNIRELENVVQRAMLDAQGASIEPQDLEFVGKQRVGEGVGKESSERTYEMVQQLVQCQYDRGQGLDEYVKSLREEAERIIILETLKKLNWNRTKAADRLKISRKTLFNKMRHYGIKQ
jgi:DNA-binding NtrC family response regulator